MRLSGEGAGDLHNPRRGRAVFAPGEPGRDRRERLQPQHPRYVDTFEPEEEIDVAAVQKDIVRIEAELADVRAKMAGI
ncbi:hypothetical protein FLP41_14475 [Paracoccus marcusii]|uniref:hypothetical protein n=1 Tax=Paracoccus marcusii TaxID=59779 RepID=UPI002ED2F39C|nr:hypothetical protein FLP41_14475 [Paracoccus marcusii]